MLFFGRSVTKIFLQEICFSGDKQTIHKVLAAFIVKNCHPRTSLEGKLTATNHNKARQVCICFIIEPFPVQVVALWVGRKPNKEFDLPVIGSQEVLFWYDRTIISLQFFTNDL